MGGKRQTKDKAYVTAQEWATEWGGAKDVQSRPLVRLPFHCCALTFTPFEDPVCTDDGACFDVLNIVPFVRRHHKHPLTGEPLELKQLTRLSFHKNSDGEYACPVLNKAFTDSSHIVAVKTTGNVYSWQAIEELNLRPKNLRDLLTDEPFTRKDLITLQDPQNVRQLRMDDLDYVRNSLQLPPKEGSVNASSSADLARTLNQLEHPAAGVAVGGGGGAAAQRERLIAELAVAKSAPKEAAPAPGISPPEAQSAARAGVVGSGFGAPMRSTGAMAASFTSSAMTPTTRNLAAAPQETGIRPAPRKAYVSMHTSHGDLNLELHADLVPVTCQNFLLLAARGFYDNVAFHRSIKHFMVQGGDPTGTGKGGASAWGKPFKDEFHPSLKHDGRGVLSMANAGPSTNGSQFFILYKSAVHLDGKHTVFGRVVGGVETTLTAMERVATDDADKPRSPILLTGITVFDNPFDDAPVPAAGPVAAPAEPEAEGLVGKWFSNPGASFATGAAGGSSVGRFLPARLLAGASAASRDGGAGSEGQPQAKRAKPSSGSGNFDAF